MKNFGAAMVLGTGLLLSVPTAASDDVQRLFDLDSFTLDNGLEVVVIENHTAPIVTHMIWYRVGAADEPPGQSGIAHFLEHMMFKGTTTDPDRDFSEEISRQGGNDNAFTSWDYTAYHQTVAVERLPIVMALEADRMRNLALDPAEVLTERDVIIEERRQRTDSSPSARLGEQMAAARYRNHPYGIPIIGWEHEMETLSIEQLADFYDTWYAPNNAIVVISGDITAEEARPLVEAAYGDIEARPVPERVRPSEPPVDAVTTISLSDPTVNQPQWRRIYRVPSYSSTDSNEPYALQVMAEVLGGTTTSPLYRSLVLEQQLATSAGAFYSGDNRDYGRLFLFASPAPETDLATLEQALDDLVAEFLSEGPDPDDVAAAKRRLTTAATYARDGFFEPARIVGAALSNGESLEAIEEWPLRIAAVTAEETLDVAIGYLRPENGLTGYLLPESVSEIAQ
ncbi:MAG: pitrilysin family protein [Pseudomonadota bacterium]